MAIVKMSVHQALASLKMIEPRFLNAIRSNTFVLPNKASNKKVQGKSIEDTGKNITSAYDSAMALAARADRIKRAIVMSNAMTVVEIGGKKYTVAEAIDTKVFMRLKRQALEKLKADWTSAQVKVNRENEMVETKFQAFVKDALGGDIKAEEMQSQRELYFKANEYHFIDPLNIAEKIQNLQSEIEAFENEVDYKLSESNATTFVEVED